MPTKDKQGVERGKCNTCDECEEYTPPKVGARCDYCNHTPVDHVRIIKLGACKKCSECEEYESEYANSYTDCQYCECKALDHAGAEKLRKKNPPKDPSAAAGPQVSPSRPSPGGDKCKAPGCMKPCYVESNGKKHDYCSRTCASKAAQSGMSMMSSSVMYPIPSSRGGPVSGGAQPIVTAGNPRFPVPPRIIGQPSFPQSATSSQPQSTGPGGKVCVKCGLKASNAGYKWCESCFNESKES